MENFELTYSAFLFPAIPLMMLTFGNRWISLSSLIRKVHSEFEDKKLNLTSSSKDKYLAQIQVLNRKLRYVKLMQLFSGISFLLNLLTIITGMFSNRVGIFLFSAALISFCFAILVFLFEIQISSNALKMHLEDLEK